MTEVSTWSQPVSVTARELTYDEVADLDRLRAVLASACDRTEARAIAWLWDSMVSAHGGRPAPAGFVEAVATALGDLLAVHVPGVHWTVWPGPSGPTLGVVSYARPQAPVVLFLDAQDRWNARARDWVVDYLSRAAAHLSGHTVPQQRRALEDEAAPPYEPVDAPTTDASATLPVRVAAPVDVPPMPIAPLVPAPQTAGQGPDRFAPQGSTPVPPPIPVTLLTRASVSVAAPSAPVPMAPGPVTWEPAAPIADLPAAAPEAEPPYMTPAIAEPTYMTPAVAEPVYVTPAIAEPTYMTPAIAEPTYMTPPVAEPTYVAPAVTPPVAVTLPPAPAFAAPVFASAPPMPVAAPFATAPFAPAPVAPAPVVPAPSFAATDATPTFTPVAEPIAPTAVAPSPAPQAAPGTPLESFALDALDHAMVLLRETGSFDREVFVMLLDGDGRRHTESCTGDPGEARFRARELVRSSGAARAAITYVERNPLELPGPRQTFPAVLVDAFDAGNGGLRVGRRFVDDVLGTGPIGAPLVVGHIARLL
jgi:hypothetical protein